MVRPGSGNTRSVVADSETTRPALGARQRSDKSSEGGPRRHCTEIIEATEAVIFTAGRASRVQQATSPHANKTAETKPQPRVPPVASTPFDAGACGQVDPTRHAVCVFDH